MILLHSNSPNVVRRECVIYSPANEPFLAGASYFFLLLLHFTAFSCLPLHCVLTLPSSAHFSLSLSSWH